MSDTAIVILAIGDEYYAFWQKYCEPSCRAYADKHGYDLIVVRESLDRSARGQGRSPSWQKCLVLSQDFSQRYRQIVLLDGDIVINAAAAPRITDQVPVDRVGGVICGSHIHEDLRCLLANRLGRMNSEYVRGLKNWEAVQQSAYAIYGLKPFSVIIQAGVLVASPAHHRLLFEAVYNAPEIHSTRCYEQIPLSHAILSNDLFCPIDTRFNSVFYETAMVYYPYLTDEKLPYFNFAISCAVQTELLNNFFLHFAYERTLVRYLPPAR